ncbi:MAG: DUF4912 domain-containing protein [Acidobacteriota bacterium]
MIIVYLVLLTAAIAVLIYVAHSVKKPLTVPEKKPFDMEIAEETLPREKIRRFAPPPPELPNGYADSRVVLMARDPEWLFAYWEINHDHWNNVMQTYGQQAASHDNLTLRVVEMCDDMSFFDISVRSSLGEWHIHVNKPDSPFYCMLGLRYEGNFVPLAVSNTVVTSRNSISNVLDDEWMLVNDYEQRLLKRIGETPIDVSSTFFFRK